MELTRVFINLLASLNDLNYECPSTPFKLFEDSLSRYEECFPEFLQVKKSWIEISHHLPAERIEERWVTFLHEQSPKFIRPVRLIFEEIDHRLRKLKRYIFLPGKTEKKKFQEELLGLAFHELFVADELCRFFAGEEFNEQQSLRREELFVQIPSLISKILEHSDFIAHAQFQDVVFALGV